MQFTSKLSPEQWAEARRLRAGGASCKDIAKLFGLGASTVSRRARREGWPGPAGSALPGHTTSASPAAAGIRSRMALRLYRIIECRLRLLELHLHRQLRAHLEAGAGDAAPPPAGKDERDGFAALIASINQVTEMASEPAPADQGRRKAATGPVSPELTALSDDIDPGGLAVASEKDQYRRELAEHLAKLFTKP